MPDPHVDLNTYLDKLDKKIDLNTDLTKAVHQALVGINGKNGLIDQVEKNSRQISINTKAIAGISGAMAILITLYQTGVFQ